MAASIGDLHKLPCYALLAFAARCARRVVALYEPNQRETLSISHVRHALDIVERSAAKGQCREGIDAYAGPMQAYEAFIFESYDAFNSDNPESCARAAVNGAIDAQMAIAAGRPDNALAPAAGAAEAALLAGQAVGHGAEDRLAGAIRQDFDLLVEAAQENEWNDSTPVPTHFFAHNSLFDVDREIEGHSIIEVSGLLSRRLFEYFRRYPKRLRDLSPRQFEELIAELFAGFGFSVELTKQTRDGGKDIVAVKHNSTKDKYLVEVKRWAECRRVGIDVVQRMYGVVHLESAYKGIIVTTSSFTKPALDIIKTHWELEGADLDVLTRWLECFQHLQMMRTLGIALYEDFQGEE